MGSYEAKIIESISEQEKIIADATSAIGTLNSQLSEERILKDLLFEQGKPLENAVIKALGILGYKAENYDDGVLELDQIILSPEGYRYIGECEGKNEKDNLPGEIQVTATFKPVSCGTELQIVQENLPDAIPPEACYLGWQESLRNLAKLVEPEINQ